MASPAAVAQPRVRGGVFGTSSAALYFCGLCPGKKPYFRTADAKARHLERTHGALVWDLETGPGYGYEVS